MSTNQQEHGMQDNGNQAMCPIDRLDIGVFCNLDIRQRCLRDSTGEYIDHSVRSNQLDKCNLDTSLLYLVHILNVRIDHLQEIIY